MNIETITTALDTLKAGLTSETEIAGSELQKLSDYIDHQRATIIAALDECSSIITTCMTGLQKSLEEYHSDRRQAMSAMIASPAPMQQAAE